MTYRELILKYDFWKDIYPRVRDVWYFDNKEYGYLFKGHCRLFNGAFTELKVLKPETTQYQLVIKKCPEGYCEVLCEENGELYALDFLPWEEILGMTIHPDTLQSFSEVAILWEVLWEMTFYGFSAHCFRRWV